MGVALQEQLRVQVAASGSVTHNQEKGNNHLLKLCSVQSEVRSGVSIVRVTNCSCLCDKHPFAEWF